MATREEQIAANQNRARIPETWLRELATWSTESLLSFYADAEMPAEKRNWARWEVEYREAFNVADLPDSPEMTLWANRPAGRDFIARRQKGRMIAAQPILYGGAARAKSERIKREDLRDAV